MSCDCEPVKFYTKKIRIARKEHKCCECGLSILPGDKYKFESFMVDSVESCKTCLPCCAVSSWLTSEYDDCCINPGDLFNEAVEQGVINRVNERVYIDGVYSHTNKGQWFVNEDFADEVELVNGVLRLKEKSCN
jgi:hypothetical protein